MDQLTDYTPAALYARVSSDRQDVDLSVAAQLRALRDYARKNGYLVAREYVDEAESGRIADRPEFRKMIDAASKTNAPFREILVWKFSRFTRKREHAVAFKSLLRRKGVRVVSITEQADDTPTGKLLEGIIESVDEFYSENLAQEVLRGMRESASRGFWIGSRKPYGYNRVMVQDGAKKRPTLELDPDTSPVVERIFDMAQAGKGMLPIAETLNDEGVASPAGKLWSKNTVHFILKNEVYTGTLIWGAKSKDKAEPVRVEKAFPAIVSKTRFRRVNSLMRSRAPKIAHPRRVASSYLLSGLVKCKACNRALSGQDAKSGQFSYYVCQSIMKRGKDACKTPRLNARRFEEMVVGKIRSNVLTDGNIRALVKVVDEQMDGVAQEQRTKLETIEDELEDVKRKLGRIWHFIETADNVEMTDASDRIREHRDRQGRLEDLAVEARAILSQRRADLDDVETIAAYAQDMSEFLKESELTERRAFIETFVKEIVVMPGDALLRYTIPMPDDSRIPGGNAEEMPLDGSVLSTVKIGGPGGSRTPDLLNAIETRSQLRHRPRNRHCTTACSRGRRGGAGRATLDGVFDSAGGATCRQATSWRCSSKRRGSLRGMSGSRRAAASGTPLLPSCGRIPASRGWPRFGPTTTPRAGASWVCGTRWSTGSATRPGRRAECAPSSTPSSSAARAVPASTSPTPRSTSPPP